MPPKKEPCRNFQRGSCQYGERCKFLHVTPQQSKPNVFGFGVQTRSQWSDSQQQRPNPFGFGIQGNSQPRGYTETASKQTQFKPFENKWTRFSPISNGGSQVSRQPENQPLTANHKCTDPDTCKRQIIEDFEHERPLWKLTCYGHSKSASCDIVGDISGEELRAAAYDDAKHGLSLLSIVERERSLLNTKLLEFETLIRNPYVRKDFSAETHSTSPVVGPSAPPTTTPNSLPPSVSSFSQLGGSLNMGLEMRFGQQNSIQVPSQAHSGFGSITLPIGSAGELGGQHPNQTLVNFFTSTTASFSNSAISMERNTYFSSPASPQIPTLAVVPSAMFPKGPNSASTAVGHLSATVDTNRNRPRENGTMDDNIWFKEEWNPGEIPEEAPPDKYIF